KTFASLNKYPAETPFWIGLFAEGTRQTPEKLAQSQQYCRENGKPVLKNVLWPRTRGFASTIEGLKGKVDAVYCFNMCCPDKERMPSFLGLLCAKPAVIQVSMRRYPVSDLPKTEEGLKEFCCRVHIEKDQLMEEVLHQRPLSGCRAYLPAALGPAPVHLVLDDSSARRPGLPGAHVEIRLVRPFHRRCSRHFLPPRVRHDQLRRC
ncbi:1-acyl-sn-glycerol-3-phosphate acyltransferase 3, partial [Diplonema papillatum]